MQMTQVIVLMERTIIHLCQSVIASYHYRINPGMTLKLRRYNSTSD